MSRKRRGVAIGSGLIRPRKGHQEGQRIGVSKGFESVVVLRGGGNYESLTQPRQARQRAPGQGLRRGGRLYFWQMPETGEAPRQEESDANITTDA